MCLLLRWILEIGMFRECCGQQNVHWCWYALNFNQEFGTPVFPQQLTTTSTWSDVCSIANAGDGYKSTATTHVQLADHGALCAQGEPE
jgi:hypothetical protein